MEASDEKQTPFNERAALEELERLHQQIVWHQSQRRKAEDDFEQFVRSFKGGGTAAAAPVPEQAAPATPKPLAQPSIGDAAKPQPAAAEPALPMSPPTRRSGRRLGVSAAAVVVIATGGFLAWTFRQRGPEPPPATPAVAEAPARPAVTEPRPTPPAEPARPRSELTTIRPVWIRVIVDGERILEREVPAGTTVPLAPKNTLVIRTGDAGAVRLTIAGQDRGFLGREGEVVTRTFAVPPPAEPGR